MEAYLFCEKPVLCYNRKCMASGTRYLKKVWIERNGREFGGFFECQVCGAMHIHLKTYQSKTMNPEVTLLNPNDEKSIIREYTLKRYKMKENKELERRNRREIELDRLYREERKKMEEGLRYYNCDKEGFYVIAMSTETM